MTDALRLHMDAIVVDGHADTIGRALDDGEDLGTDTGKGHLDLPRMFRGGLDAQFMSCFVEPKYIPRKEAAKRAFRMIDAVKQWAAKYPERLAIARTAADVRRAAAAKKVCGILCIEGGHAIEDDLGLLRTFFELGVRYMTLTWNNSLSWAEAARDPGKVKGLSDFGREVVREMNRLGMLVDLSHVHENTFWDAIAISNTPVIASHSCARALCDHVRNLKDDQLRALAKNGGVVMVNFYPVFLSDEVAAADKERDKKLAADIAALKAKDPSEGEVYDAGIAKLYAENPLPQVSYTVIVDHIDHIVKVAGIDHAGIGSDWDGITSTPAGMEDVSKLPAIRAELKKRGYSETDINKIMGENLMRVFGEVERVAKTMK